MVLLALSENAQIALISGALGLAGVLATGAISLLTVYVNLLIKRLDKQATAIEVITNPETGLVKQLGTVATAVEEGNKVIAETKTNLKEVHDLTNSMQKKMTEAEVGKATAEATLAERDRATAKAEIEAKIEASAEHVIEKINGFHELKEDVAEVPQKTFDKLKEDEQRKK